MENPGKSWKKVVMESHGKVMENSKISEFHGNLFSRKKVMEKSWKSVVQICLIVFVLCCDQCGSRLYSSVSLITTIVLHLCYKIYLHVYLECQGYGSLPVSHLLAHQLLVVPFSTLTYFVHILLSLLAHK